jgi:uncharacterized membrane protein YdbT with pleckstrin-like domain
MAFPRKLLIPGEQLVLELRPHPVALVLAALGTVGALILAVWLSTQVFDSSTVNGIVWIALLVFVVAYPLRKLVWWLTSDFVVTSSRVIHREGFIAKRSMEIPLDKINDVRFEQGIFERIVGAGTLVIQSASESGRNEFRFIRHPEEVQKTIYHESEADQTRTVQRATPSPAATAPGAPSTTTELERLADLRARGVLTEEEFQAQKARILGQG